LDRRRIGERSRPIGWGGSVYPPFISLSKPAQQRLRALRRIPARSDVEPLSPKMDQSKLKLAIALRDSVEEYNTSIKEFREIFGR